MENKKIKPKKRKRKQYFHPAPGTTNLEIQKQTAMISDENWFEYLNLHSIIR